MVSKPRRARWHKKGKGKVKDPKWRERALIRRIANAQAELDELRSAGQSDKMVEAKRES